MTNPQADPGEWEDDFYPCCEHCDDDHGDHHTTPCQEGCIQDD